LPRRGKSGGKLHNHLTAEKEGNRPERVKRNRFRGGRKGYNFFIEWKRKGLSKWGVKKSPLEGGMFSVRGGGGGKGILNPVVKDGVLPYARRKKERGKKQLPEGERAAVLVRTKEGKGGEEEERMKNMYVRDCLTLKKDGALHL